MMIQSYKEKLASRTDRKGRSRSLQFCVLKRTIKRVCQRVLIEERLTSREFDESWETQGRRERKARAGEPTKCQWGCEREESACRGRRFGAREKKAQIIMDQVTFFYIKFWKPKELWCGHLIHKQLPNPHRSDFIIPYKLRLDMLKRLVIERINCVCKYCSYHNLVNP